MEFVRIDAYVSPTIQIWRFVVVIVCHSFSVKADLLETTDDRTKQLQIKHN